MKKSKKTLLTALTLMSSVSMTSCFYAVYGPPPDEDISVSSSESVSVTEEKNTTEEVIDSEEEYNPAYEEQVNVYGPPPDMGE